MPTSPTTRWLAGLSLLAILLFSAFLWLRPILSIGGGYAAKHACSCHFLQGRALDEISSNDLNFSVLGWYGLTVDSNLIPEELLEELPQISPQAFGLFLPKQVTSSLFGIIERRAVYRRGIGCTLITDEDYPTPWLDASWTAYPPLVMPLPTGSYRAPLDTALLWGGSAGASYFAAEPEAFFLTGRDSTVDVADQRYSSELEAALDYGMQPVPGGSARGIVILQDGKLVAERYAEGYTANTPLLGWSMTKTLTGLLVGTLTPTPSADKGSFATVGGRRGLFPELWTDKRREISLADLLHMNSGLAWNEGYGTLTDATVMLHERPDFADFALRSQLTELPGTYWAYSSGTSNILMEYLRREVGGNDALYGLIDSVFGKVAPSLLIEPDQSGRPVGSSYGWATARDWARLGQLMLQDGVWDGDTLLPAGWVDFMREPAAGSEGVYGGHLWLPGPDIPALPADAYMMRGFQDQRVFIVPSRNMVIARLGHGEDKVTDFDGLVSRILTAAAGS
ncbi:hypothetical protein LEM8419_00392 [Neolewinella maritima]|uniref:Beta-lactamase-related domain-containing protein n=1 Tax=Neolewinella maritima TaxID=1383882 RepID=A0ABM9AWK1_9BACT|nr:serine hydrolase [Neolewinella maritima]CAH0999097.1 hypothetical protein LEM8419_00392 [Neolewinella maritima]